MVKSSSVDSLLSIYKEYILETNMSYGVFNSYNAKTDVSRYKIFMNRIKDNNTFTFDGISTDVKIDQKLSYYLSSKYSKINSLNDLLSSISEFYKDKPFNGKKLKEFIIKNGKYYMPELLVIYNDEYIKIGLNKIVKDKEFGGGYSGSGGGAYETKKNGILAGIVIQMVQNSKDHNLDLSEIDKEHFLKARDMLVDNSNYKNNIELDALVVRTDWHDTFLKTAELIYDKFKNEEFIVHYDSDLITKIKKVFNKKRNKDSLVKNINKFNPSDLWLVNKNADVPGMIKELSKIESLIDLRDFILEKFENKELIGVSLKKIEGHNLTYHNTNNKDKSVLPKIKKDDFYRFSLNSIDVYLIGDGVKDMQFRTFNKEKSWQGEIIGKVAKHGKISMGPLNYFLKERFGQEINNPKKDRLSRIYDLLIKYCKDDTFYKYKNDKELFLSDFNSKKSYIVSKYNGLKMIDIMARNKNNIQSFFEDIYKYASSETIESSAFIKIS